MANPDALNFYFGDYYEEPKTVQQPKAINSLLKKINHRELYLTYDRVIKSLFSNKKRY